MYHSRPTPFSVLFLLLTPSLAAQTVWHVDASAQPGGDGASWATAFDSLQSALDVAALDEQIWVAAGTYHPTARTNPTNPRSARFPIPGDYRIYGGFAGHETSLAERDPALYVQTILSGDLGVTGDPSDNAYRVIELPTFALPGIARIDGFRITGGNAIGNGGGVLAKMGSGGYNPRATFVHCTFDDNHAEKGGAISVENFGVVQLLECVVERNGAATQGGAVYSFAGGCRAVATRFSDNQAGTVGGALFIDSSDVGWNVFADCLFVDNSANRGAAAYLRGDDFYAGIGDFYQCTFQGNQAATSGGALHAVTNTPVPARVRLYNSVLWGNTAPSEPSIFGLGLDVRYSDVQGGYVGAGNLDLDPRLRSDGRPRAGSPVNDAGSNALLVNDFLDLDQDGDTAEELPLDLLGRPRRSDDGFALDTGEGLTPVVGMGAYETTNYEGRR